MKKNIAHRARHACVCLAACLCFSLFCHADAETRDGYTPPEPGSPAFALEWELLSRTSETMAPDGCYTTRQAIAALILNRAKHPAFPSDVLSVIATDRCFPSMGEPAFFKGDVSALSRVAARDALLGFDVTAGALYVCRGSPVDGDGACFGMDGFLFYRDAMFVPLADSAARH